MIMDALENAGLYSGLGGGIAEGMRFLAETDVGALEAGRHEIDGERLYVMVIDYETKPVAEGAWEAHRRYVDIQYVASGAERIGVARTDTLDVTTDYDEDKDVLMLEGEGNMLSVPAGTFLILFPQDAHMPGLAAGSPQPVRKIVVKVRLD